MILHYRLNQHFKTLSVSPTIIFIHGLFGNLTNFNTLSRALSQEYYNTLQIDLRNHGKSSHHVLMSYTVMAQDIFDVLDHLSISQCIVIGHSMGGKVSMTLPRLTMDRIIKMIIIDIAPMTYMIYKHYNIFSAVNYVNTLRIIQRNEASHAMEKFISDQNIIAFLLKSFKKGKWDFNIQNIQENYLLLNKWENYKPWTGDILFIYGNRSEYIKKCYYKHIYKQFPRASIHMIDGAGHWVHAEKHNEVVNTIVNFLSHT